MRKPLTPAPVESALKGVLAPLARRLDGDLVCEILPGVGSATYGDPGALAECVAELVQAAISSGVRRALHIRVARQFAGWAPTKTVMVTVLAGEPGAQREVGHEELALPSADEDAASNELAATRLLVVAPSARVRRVATRAAERFGAETSEASDAETAIARLRDHAARGSAFHAVLVDAVTVDRGLTLLLDRLRSDGSLGGPVTLVATSGDERDRTACLEAGAAVTFEKPLLPRELRDAVAAARAANGAKAALARAAAKLTEDRGPTGLARSPARAPRASARKLRFLVVEDESLNARFAHLAIRRLGHEAVHVGNGREATDMLGKDRFDVVLLDLALPELDGYAVARWVRHRERAGVRLPIVALGGPEVDRARIAAAGFDGILAKPVDVSALAETVRRLVPTEDER